MSTPRYTLRQMVGRMMARGNEPVLLTGTPGGGFTTTGFTCAALALYEDDYLNTWNGRFFLGTHKDINFEVTDFAQVGGTPVFSPAVTGAVDATDLFELHRDFTPDEINNAINMAIAMVELEALAGLVDETLTVVADEYEYAIPSTFYTLSDVYQESPDASNIYPQSERIAPELWKILPGATNNLWFDSRYAPLSDGCGLRLVGQQKAPALSLDASTTAIPSSYLVQQAKAFLHQSRGELEDFKMAQMMADRERGNVFVVAPRGWNV